MLRNYIGIQTTELKRLRGDLTAYRQEAQTNFGQNVAYPRATVDLGRVSNPSEDFTDEVRSEITDASVYEQTPPPDAPIKPFRIEESGVPLGLIPLYTNPLKANPLTPPDKTPVTIQQKSIPPIGVPAMPIKMSDLTAGGKRRGAGRKPRNFKSNVELRKILKAKYGVTGLSRLNTNRLREMIVSTTGDDRIIFKS